MVVLTTEDKRELSSLRWKWGFVLAIVWIGGWWMYLNAEHKATLARQQNCETVKGAINTAGCHGSNIASTTASGFSTFFGVVFAVITSPIGFVGAHYAAKAKVEGERRKAIALEGQAAQALLREEEAARLARLATADATNKQVRSKIHREEFILKLGSVTDLLKLLPTAEDRDARLLIVQGVEKELRELVAKHPLAALKALIADDEAIQFKLKAIGPRLAEQGIDSDDARLILSLLPN